MNIFLFYSFFCEILSFKICLMPLKFSLINVSSIIWQSVISSIKFLSYKLESMIFFVHKRTLKPFLQSAMSWSILDFSKNLNLFVIELGSTSQIIFPLWHWFQKSFPWLFLQIDIFLVKLQINYGFSLEAWMLGNKTIFLDQIWLFLLRWQD